LRNAIAHPDRVVQNTKRYMGDFGKVWKIEDTKLTPQSVSSAIIEKLLLAAVNEVGIIREAVITVPAQFNDAQRYATIQAGHAAGLSKVEIINEPVAAALCHVLGGEGIAFTELAIDQQLMIFDLGGGTLDLAIVSYTNDEVKVVASDGDLELGGLDWTATLVDMAAERFIQALNSDPRQDSESHQALILEAEQAKRSLSVRPRATIVVVHEGNRQTYQIGRDEFEARCERQVKRCGKITRRILKDNQLGWAHVDTLLTTGGASRMPMIKDALQDISGRTLNTTLSPDQSIAHGAAYYAGMLLSNRKVARTVFDSQASSRLARIRQSSVTARALGIMVRNGATGERVPHYLIKPNTALPVSRTQSFGTVVDNQTTVRVRLVESGAGPDKPHNELGDCEIAGLPEGLPEGSQVDVTISYDAQARVHVSARELTSNMTTEVEIIRESSVIRPTAHPDETSETPDPETPQSDLVPAEDSMTDTDEATTPESDSAMSIRYSLETLAGLSESDPDAQNETDTDVQFCCSICGRPLNKEAECEVCVTDSQVLRSLVSGNGQTQQSQPPAMNGASSKPTGTNGQSGVEPGHKSTDSEDEFWNLVDEA